jgi:excisionase family DNA binding protein
VDNALRRCFQCFRIFPTSLSVVLLISLELSIQNSSQNMETMETSSESTVSTPLSIGPKWKHKWKQNLNSETTYPPTPPDRERNELICSTGIIQLTACINSYEAQHMKNRYMTTREVATELEVSVATVGRWVRNGMIPAKRFGKRIIKIPCVEVEKLLNQQHEQR